MADPSATDVARPGPSGRRVRSAAAVGAVVRRGRRRPTASTTGPGDDVDALVQAARGGDRAAFDALVEATYTDAYTLAHRLTGDDDDARDVVQDAYLRAYRGLRRFRGDAQFSTWLYRITANCAATHLGRRTRHRHDELHEDLEVVDTRPAHDPHGRVEHLDLRDRVREAVQALPPKLRAVIVLRDIYDLSHDAIATELGISESAAKVRLHRARRRLRDDVALRAATGRGEDHPDDSGEEGRARAV